MYCPQCGATNEDTAGSCAACGFDLDQYRQQWEGESGQPPRNNVTPELNAQQPPVQEPAQEQQPPYQQPPYQQPPYQQPPYRQPSYQPPLYQRGYQPPPYQTDPYGTRPPYGYIPHIPSYLGWAIAVLILCFWPTGIAAVVFAAQVDNKLARGDFEGAQQSSRKAKMWCWISFGVAVGFWVIGIAVAVIVALVAVSSTNIY